MVTFNDLKFEPHAAIRGVRAVIDFPNGYSASVIRGEYSYGGRHGLYELGVMRDESLVYDTQIGDDVVGHLTPEGVTALLVQIEALPAVVNS